MKRLLIGLIAVTLLSSFAVADETESQGFWDTLRSKIEKVTPRKKASVTTAVGGVRGSQADAANDLYWKGKEDVFAVTDAELTQFASALELAAAGETAQAIQQFERFLVQYPQSPLREDTVLALERLRSLPTAGSGSTPGGGAS